MGSKGARDEVGSSSRPLNEDTAAKAQQPSNIKLVDQSRALLSKHPCALVTQGSRLRRFGPCPVGPKPKHQHPAPLQSLATSMSDSARLTSRAANALSRKGQGKHNDTAEQAQPLVSDSLCPVKKKLCTTTPLERAGQCGDAVTHPDAKIYPRQQDSAVLQQGHKVCRVLQHASGRFEGLPQTMHQTTTYQDAGLSLRTEPSISADPLQPTSSTSWLGKACSNEPEAISTQKESHVDHNGYDRGLAAEPLPASKACMQKQSAGAEQGVGKETSSRQAVSFFDAIEELSDELSEQGSEAHEDDQSEAQMQYMEGIDPEYSCRDTEAILMNSSPRSEHGGIAAWLERLGCKAYVALFCKAGLSIADLKWLTDGDLKQLGIQNMSHRYQILKADNLQQNSSSLSCQRLPTKQRAPDVEKPLGPVSGLNRPQLGSTAFQRHSKSEGVPEERPASITDFFISNKPVRRGCITDFFSGSSSGKGKENLPAETKPVDKQFSRQTSAPHSKPTTAVVKSGANTRPKAWVPDWHKVPGTSFIVDQFGRKVEESHPCRSWFLTHFHADHYGGLNGRFKAGVVYCTQITATLCNIRLNVHLDRIRVVQLNCPILVEGVKVTYLDANHCPGAAMVLFEVPGRRPVLHCGDCRCNPRMQEEPALQVLRDRKLELYLDTTYCSPEYDFPAQNEVLRFVIDAFKAEKYNQNKTLFLFGSYTIGKERLFLEAARVLQQKIYVSKAKRKVLDALSLPTDYKRLLTDNDHEATIQAVPMNMVNMKRMALIAKHYRSRFTTIVGIQPTGWTHTQARGKASRGKRLQKGSLILYSVPYSEHSSFKELKSFVDWLKPARLVPTVGNDRGYKAHQMISLLNA